jgi:hypothetical protein
VLKSCRMPCGLYVEMVVLKFRGAYVSRRSTETDRLFAVVDETQCCQRAQDMAGPSTIKEELVGGVGLADLDTLAGAFPGHSLSPLNFCTGKPHAVH